MYLDIYIVRRREYLYYDGSTAMMSTDDVRILQYVLCVHSDAKLKSKVINAGYYTKVKKVHGGNRITRL